MKTLIQIASSSQETPWVDYSATSTVTGWSSFSTKSIRYKVVGKLVLVTFNITGTSNASSTNFTLPFPVSASGTLPLLSQGNGIDNGVINIISPTVTSALPSLVQITYYTGINSVTGTWTSSGTKAVRGQFYYEIA